MNRENGKLGAVANWIDREVAACGAGNVTWVKARESVKGMLADYVHLDEDGYRVWDEHLWEIVQDMGLDLEDQPVSTAQQPSDASRISINNLCH
jgi:hypothetical protein